MNINLRQNYKTYDYRHHFVRYVAADSPPWCSLRAWFVHFPANYHSLTTYSCPSCWSAFQNLAVQTSDSNHKNSLECGLLHLDFASQSHPYLNQLCQTLILAIATSSVAANRDSGCSA